MNPLRGEGELNAAGNTYRLAFDVSAFCYAEKALAPMSTDEIVAQIADGTANMTLLRAVVWAALQRHHPEVSLAQAGEVMSDASMPAVRAAITSGLEAAFGLADGDDGENPRNGEGGIGSTSSPSGVKPASNRTRSGGKHPG